MPELSRIRGILGQERVFLVVEDAFMTETAALADLVLPAAIWGEKTGTFTNADRTVHLSEKAVEPPGQARSDLEIVLSLAERLGVTDRAGDPLLPWKTPEEVYRAWQECSRGRPCDYSAITYERLRDEGGIQWGGERLYGDGVFPTSPETTEDFGHDLLTGAAWTEAEHKALGAAGRAVLRAAEFEPPPEQPTEEFPLIATTGRSVHHFHTRTKTGRAPELQSAAPGVWVEVASGDASRLGITDGDVVHIHSPRGHVRAPARIGRPRDGVVFLPFHYGWWERDDPDDSAATAANELTMTVWDPVSRQPTFKVCAVRVERSES
jgi:anaerobic selenocysteine-containing dehydrogenase